MEISATQLKERLDRGEDLVLLDIRKPYELSIASLENVMHIPEEEIADRLDELRVRRRAR
ncbi:hypothetical protein KF707_10980 [Candidatus Obscuribacterales bacterium]|nr:hypothetical protein [Candidatus Obscuribacterales bacterium]